MKEHGRASFRAVYDFDFFPWEDFERGGFKECFLGGKSGGEAGIRVGSSKAISLLLFREDTIKELVLPFLCDACESGDMD